MLTFIETEFTKLKNSKIFLLTLLGALVVPIIFGIMIINGHETTFADLLNQTNAAGLLINYILYAIIISYLFGREYTEHTLKTMMTIPTSREKFLIGKYIMFFIWTLILVAVMIFVSIILAFLGDVSNITYTAAITGIKEILITQSLLFLSFSPFVFISLIIPNMVGAMVGGACLSVANMFIWSYKYASFFPWASPYLIATKQIDNGFYVGSPATSLIIIFATFIIGLVISYIYFSKKDISL